METWISYTAYGNMPKIYYFSINIFHHKVYWCIYTSELKELISKPNYVYVPQLHKYLVAIVDFIKHFCMLLCM